MTLSCTIFECDLKILVIAESKSFDMALCKMACAFLFIFHWMTISLSFSRWSEIVENPNFFMPPCTIHNKPPGETVGTIFAPFFLQPSQIPGPSGGVNRFFKKSCVHSQPKRVSDKQPDRETDTATGEKHLNRCRLQKYSLTGCRKNRTRDIWVHWCTLLASILCSFHPPYIVF